MRQNIIPIFIIAFFLFSCARERKINPKDVESIKFYCMPKGIEFCHGMDSFERLKTQSEDTTVFDRSFINTFIAMVNRLEPNYESNYGDFRCAAVINNKKNPPCVIMFGEFFGIKYDDQVMNNNSALIEYIDQQIYSTQPWDHWWPESTRILLRRIEEVSKQADRIDQSILNE